MLFLETENVIEINKIEVNRSGGLIGIRDNNLLESAIARPINLYYYEKADIYELASCYAFAITKNHPFLDGNKRTALISMLLFLELNDMKIKIPTQDAVDLMLNIATDKTTIKKVAKQLKNYTIKQ